MKKEKIVLHTTKSVNKSMVRQVWIHIDATNQIVGRLATHIAILLRGKDKPFYTPHVDCGVHVVVTNAEKILFTGKKEKNKRYLSYTGYPGGQRATTPAQLRNKYPERILEKAVRGMLPKNKLARQLFTKLKVYAGKDHPHAGQIQQSHH